MNGLIVCTEQSENYHVQECVFLHAYPTVRDEDELMLGRNEAWVHVIDFGIDTNTGAPNEDSSLYGWVLGHELLHEGYGWIVGIFDAEQQFVGGVVHGEKCFEVGREIWIHTHEWFEN